MNKTLILVVEDDTPVRNLITTTLKTHDYKYLAAPDGTSAILEASSHNPDIVLLDLGLPDIDGVEVIRKIRSWSNMPIIVISARTEDSDKIEALDAGADDFNAEDNVFEITTDPDAFNDVVKALEEKNYAFVSADISLVPQTYVKLESDEDIKNMEKLLDMLDDNEDVQNTYHNWDQD